MLIRDVLHHKGNEVATIAAEATSLEALDVLNERHIGSLIVIGADGELAGILSERDLLAHFREIGEDIPVSRIMTPRSKLIVAQEGDTVEYAMSVMTEHRIRHLPVFEDGRLIGLVSIGDVMKAVSSDLKSETRLLEDYIAGSQAIIH